MEKAELTKIIIIPNGVVEAFYVADSVEGPQNAAVPIHDDVSALVASAQAQIDDAFAKLAPQMSKPAELVAAVTALGQAKADEAEARRQLADLKASAAEATAKAQADMELLTKQSDALAAQKAQELSDLAAALDAKAKAAAELDAQIAAKQAQAAALDVAAAKVAP